MIGHVQHRSRRAFGATVVLLCASPLGCAARAVPAAPASYVRAQAASEPAPVSLPTAVAPHVAVRGPDPASFGGQLKPLPGHGPPSVGPSSASAPKGIKPSPQEVALEANRRASQAPDAHDYFNAVVQYAYEPGTLYQVYGAPMRITDIALEPGERILGQPASGDVVRWLLALGRSMANGVERSHVYLKPTRPDLVTNLAIQTDRRSYLLELRSYPDTYMAAVVWHYPEDEIARLQAQQSELATAERSAAPVVGLDQLNFDYTIQVVRGTPAWTPLQAFDDGRKTFVRFPPAMLAAEAPALFVLRAGETQLVNYRVKGDIYVLDRLVESAELRVGQQDQEIVRIVRGSVAARPLPRPLHGH